jgi:hypothetical protein
MNYNKSTRLRLLCIVFFLVNSARGMNPTFDIATFCNIQDHTDDTVKSCVLHLNGFIEQLKTPSHKSYICRQLADIFCHQTFSPTCSSIFDNEKIDLSRKQELALAFCNAEIGIHNPSATAPQNINTFLSHADRLRLAIYESNPTRFEKILAIKKIDFAIKSIKLMGMIIADNPSILNTKDTIAENAIAYLECFNNLILSTKTEPHQVEALSHSLTENIVYLNYVLRAAGKDHEGRDAIEMTYKGFLHTVSDKKVGLILNAWEDLFPSIEKKNTEDSERDKKLKPLITILDPQDANLLIDTIGQCTPETSKYSFFTSVQTLITIMSSSMQNDWDFDKIIHNIEQYWQDIDHDMQNQFAPIIKKVIAHNDFQRIFKDRLNTVHESAKGTLTEKLENIQANINFSPRKPKPLHQEPQRFATVQPPSSAMIMPTGKPTQPSSPVATQVNVSPKDDQNTTKPTPPPAPLTDKEEKQQERLLKSLFSLVGKKSPNPRAPKPFYFTKPFLTLGIGSLFIIGLLIGLFKDDLTKRLSEYTTFSRT